MTDEPFTEYETETGVFPADLLAHDRWFVWKLEDGRKIPRAPWANPDRVDTWVSWKDQETWTDFATADEWVEKGQGYGHASCIPAYESNETPRLILFDFDHCRDPETGAIHPHAWAFIDGNDLHAAVSTSGTGVHGYGWSHIPEGFKVSFTHSLDEWEGSEETPEMEVYGADRFIALTGEHIEGTPVGVPDVSDTVPAMFQRFGTERVTGTKREPKIEKEELDDLETTTDVEVIYDAIAHTRPGDIRLMSTVTKERSDGTLSMDPSWEHSDSGTRLAQLDDCWLYRKGNHRLDALQVVALEERIIMDPGDYPSGEDFVDAVAALRERGARIPKLKKSGGVSFDVTADADEAGGETPQEAAETDGGSAADSPPTDDPEPDTGRSRRSLKDRLRQHVNDYQHNDDLEKSTVIHRSALDILDEYHFVNPPEDARGWRSVLYRYDDDEGIYAPDGERFIGELAERLLGDFLTNQQVRELVGRITRLSGVERDEIQTPPNRLVVSNGILDLHTGELNEWTHKEHHRTKLDVAYRPDAECPKIDEFLHDIVRDKDVRTLYQLVAHCVYREYINEKAAMLVGDGQNGKSVFLSLLVEFLGEHNVSHRSLQDLDGQRFAANSLEGKLANLHPDMGDRTVVDLGTFKKLTGRDTMEADVKFEKTVKFENYATLIFAANRMPALEEDTHALWRRWVYLNFPYKFSDEDPDAKDPVPKRVLMRDLTDEAELEGLLARAVEELTEWYEGRDLFDSIMPPSEVRRKMKRASEPIYDFAVTCLEPADDDEWLTKEDVRACYREYARQEDLPTQPDNVFGERLLGIRDLQLESGQRREEGRRVTVYTGVQFSGRGRQVLGLDEPESDDQDSINDGGPTGRMKTIVDSTRDLQSDENAPSKGMIIGRASASMNPRRAELAFEEAKKSGEIMRDGDGFRTTD